MLVDLLYLQSTYCYMCSEESDRNHFEGVQTRTDDGRIHVRVYVLLVNLTHREEIRIVYLIIQIACRLVFQLQKKANTDGHSVNG